MRLTLKILFFALSLSAATPDVWAADEASPKKNSDWEIDDASEKSGADAAGGGIELMQAQEGTFIGAQKSHDGIMIFTGGIVVRINNKIIRAETVKINPYTGEIYGEGGVTLTDELQTIRGSSFIYDNRIGAGVLYDTKGYYEPMYLIGDFTKISSRDSFLVSAAYLTTCTAESPHYYLKARKIWLQKGNRFTAVDIVYYVANVPIFYMPFIVQTDFGTGIETTFGFNDLQGIFLQNTYFYGFSANPVLPEDAMLMFDFYQYKGIYLGTLLKKKSSFLNYDIALGVGFNKETTIISENGVNTVTNNILQEDGTVATNTTTLYEVSANLNTKWVNSTEKDRQSAMNLKFQQYNNPAFNQIFKDRNIPETSLNAFSSGTNPGSQPLIPNLLWKMVYSENWQDNNLTVSVERQQTWTINSTPGSEYQYNPYMDILPALNFSKKWYLVKPTGGIFQGISQDFQINTGLTNNYNNAEYDSSTAYGNIRTGLTAHFPFASWITFKPSAGYGLTGQMSNVADESVFLENRRKSYHYFYTLDSLYIGPTFLKAGFTYSLKLGISPPEPDPYFGNEFENKMFFNITSDFAPYGSFMAGTARDLRQYSWDAPEEHYWDPFYVAGFFDYDFVNKDNLFLPNTILPESYFLGVGMSDSLLFYTQLLNPGSNSLSLYFQTGGYQFLFFDKIRLFKAGAYWLHDFNNPHKNQLFFYLESKLQMFRTWGLDLRVSTIGLNLGDTTSDYSALTDYFNNSLSASASPFYINEFSASLEHDLHDWIIRLTYTLRQQWIPFGEFNMSSAGYYEQSVYIMFNLKGLKGSGIPKTQLWNFNPRENAAGYGLD